jgi:hypothetical protein
MRKGSISRSIMLPTSSIEPDHAPDGLTEADIDALLSEVTPSRPRPGWLSPDQVETRRSRRRSRQAARLLAATWLVGGVPSQGQSSTADGEAA